MGETRHTRRKRNIAQRNDMKKKTLEVDIKKTSNILGKKWKRITTEEKKPRRRRTKLSTSK